MVFTLKGGDIMDDMLKNQSENINENEWTFLLLMMLMEDIKQRNSQWKSFENELIYNNRFSVKHAVIDEIHECQESAKKIIKEGISQTEFNYHGKPTEISFSFNGRLSAKTTLLF